MLGKPLLVDKGGVSSLAPLCVPTVAFPAVCPRPSLWLHMSLLPPPLSHTPSGGLPVHTETYVPTVSPGPEGRSNRERIPTPTLLKVRCTDQRPQLSWESIRNADSRPSPQPALELCMASPGDSREHAQVQEALLQPKPLASTTWQPCKWQALAGSLKCTQHQPKEPPAACP